MSIRRSLLASALIGLTSFASAQDQEPDFLFGAPRGAFSIRGGYVVASADSAIHDFLTEELTIEPGDFNALVFGLDVALAVHSRIDVLIGFEVAGTQFDSEYREFDEGGIPITQTTKQRIVPLGGSLKLYITPRGRQISRFAYVPSKARPYIGAGAGLIWYRLEQTGDFVDLEDLSIFTADVQTNAWGTEFHVFGGVDVQLAPRYSLSFEGRYLWGEADVSGDFVGFAPIDLNGLRITAGLNIGF